MDTVSPQDMALVASARKMMEQAKLVNAFVEGHIAATYSLHKGDSVQPDGVIVRLNDL